MTQPDLAALRRRYERARQRRAPWEPLWQDCYDFGFPGRAPNSGDLRRGERLFDGTAPDAVDQLAASLLAQLTPPWSRWFAFAPGPDVPDERRGMLAAALDRASAVLQGHFDRSNFIVELNKIEAAHRSVFVAGWRPFIGWICGLALAWHFLGHPLAQWANAMWATPPAVPPLLDDGNLMELVLALLGLSGLRTFEKLQGRSR